MEKSEVLPTTSFIMSPSLPSDEDPTICFTTVKNLFDVIRTLDGNFLIVSGIFFFSKESFLFIKNLWIDVSLAAYKRIKIAREARGRRINFFYYQKELHITMPTGPHE